MKRFANQIIIIFISILLFSDVNAELIERNKEFGEFFEFKCGLKWFQADPDNWHDIM